MSNVPPEDRQQTAASTNKLATHSAEEADGTASAMILTIGAVFYAILCIPAIDQRGYPPIDPAWTAVTFLWIVPVLLAALVDPQLVKRLRGVDLVLYCFITGGFDAASVVLVVPKHIDLLETLLSTLLLFGPLHVIVAFLVAAIVARVSLFSRDRLSNVNGRTAPVVRATIFAGTLALAVAFPFFFREYTVFDARSRGRREADRDWKAGNALLYGEKYFASDHASVQHEFDETTGLRVHASWFERMDFESAYNTRISELIESRGTPDWSMKSHIVPDDALIAALDADDLQEVTKFPHDVNDNIVLFRRGTVSSLGYTMSSTSDSLSIATRKSGLIATDNDVEPAFVGRIPGRHAVILIRSGRTWIGAFHESGMLLSSAQRY